MYGSMVRYIGPGALPNKYICRMQNYLEEVNVVGSPPLVLTTRIMNIFNSYSLTGTQNVNSFDILNSMWGRWRVIKFTEKMVLTNISDIALHVTTLARPNDSATSPDQGVLNQNPYTRRRYVSSEQGGKPAVTFYTKIIPKDLLGKNPALEDDGIFNGVNTTPPASDMLVTYNIEAADNASGFTVNMTRWTWYVVVWYDRKQIVNTT